MAKKPRLRYKKNKKGKQGEKNKNIKCCEGIDLTYYEGVDLTLGRYPNIYNHNLRFC